MKIELRAGDLSAQTDLDALVSPANTGLTAIGDAAGALARRGGPEIEAAAIVHAPAALGTAVATPAGQLGARFVIHAVIMGFRPEDQAVPRREGTLTSDAVLRAALLNTLATADRLECRSVGLPALGAGVAGFPPDDCARLLLDVVDEYLRATPQSRIERLVFVVFIPSQHAAFERALRPRKAPVVVVPAVTARVTPGAPPGPAVDPEDFEATIEHEVSFDARRTRPISAAALEEARRAAETPATPRR